MLEEFLQKLGAVTGRTYTKQEFGKMLKEAIASDKTEKKAEDKKADSKEKKTEEKEVK